MLLALQPLVPARKTCVIELETAAGICREPGRVTVGYPQLLHLAVPPATAPSSLPWARPQKKRSDSRAVTQEKEGGRRRGDVQIQLHILVDEDIKEISPDSWMVPG